MLCWAERQIYLKTMEPTFARLAVRCAHARFEAHSRKFPKETDSIETAADFHALPLGVKLRAGLRLVRMTPYVVVIRIATWVSPDLWEEVK